MSDEINNINSNYNDVDNTDVIDNNAEEKIIIDANFSTEDLLAIIAEVNIDNKLLVEEIRNSSEMEGISFNEAEANEIVVVIVGKKLLECTAKTSIEAYEKVTFITTKDGSTVYAVPIKTKVGLRNNSNEDINPATEDKQDDIITQLKSDTTGLATSAKQDAIIIGLDEVEILKNKGTISTNNSTTALLGIDEVFTGEADDIKDYAAINIAIFADQDSAACGFSIEWSQDGTNWDEKMTVGIGASKVESYEFGVRARYFRAVYTNGGTAQGAFRLQVIYHPTRTREGARCLCVDIDPREFAKTVRSVLAAKKPDGTYTNIHATAGANLKVAVEEFEAGLELFVREQNLDAEGNINQSSHHKAWNDGTSAWDKVQINPVTGAMKVDLASLASAVTIIDSGSYFIGTEIETALQEIGAGTTLDSRYLKLDSNNDPMTGSTKWMLPAPTLTLHNTTPEDTDYGREGEIIFKGEQSGGEETTLGKIQVAHDGVIDDQKGIMSFKVNDGADGDAPTTAMTILANGNVGIGTTEPDDMLHIKSTSGNARIKLETTRSNSQASMLFYTDAGLSGAFLKYSTYHSLASKMVFKNYEDSDIEFWTNNLARVTIDNTGNIGIGTADPKNKLDIGGGLAVGATYSGTNTAPSNGAIIEGDVGIGTNTPTEKLDVNGDAIRIRTAQTPATAGSAGNQGDIRWDADYVYVCVATNTWKRTAISTW